jgi:transketolase
MTSTAAERQEWHELAQQLRVDSVRSSSLAGSGHPTSSMSAAELMAVLVAKHFHYDVAAPHAANNDHLIFSKGHASPLFYSLLLAIGAIGEEEFDSYRRLGSRLQGHPTPVLPYVDVATGSLGQGLPIGVGVAIAGKSLDKLPYRVWVLCGDSELAEGSIWEAAAQASYDKLDNLIAILDINRLGQTGPTRYGWDLDIYSDRFKAFGWDVIEIDGHDVAEVDAAYDKAAKAAAGKPTVIVAKTIKGKGVAAVENKNGAHGKPVPDEAEAIKELGGLRNIRLKPQLPEGKATAHAFKSAGPVELPKYELGASVATRKAYGDALLAIGRADPRIVVIDGEVGNSTYTETFGKAIPERFFQMYIAEQQMISTAVGMQVRGWKPFASTFAAFFSRAYDFVRMAAVSRANICLCGSHAGVSIGEDGPSQMGLEDLASMRAVFGSTVVYPCDANQAAKLLAVLADTAGVTYIRTTRQATPVIYGPDEDFELGGSRVLKSSTADALTIIGAGITVPEAMAAAETLAGGGTAARVIDLYSIKPLDLAALRSAATDTGHILTVEDHWPQGGLGEAVFGALAEAGLGVKGELLAIRHMPDSATPEQELAEAGIDRVAIVAAAKRLLAK